MKNKHLNERGELTQRRKTAETICNQPFLKRMKTKHFHLKQKCWLKTMNNTRLQSDCKLKSSTCLQRIHVSGRLIRQTKVHRTDIPQNRMIRFYQIRPKNCMTNSVNVWTKTEPEWRKSAGIAANYNDSSATHIRHIGKSLPTRGNYKNPRPKLLTLIFECLIGCAYRFILSIFECP